MNDSVVIWISNNYDFSVRIKALIIYSKWFELNHWIQSLVFFLGFLAIAKLNVANHQLNKSPFFWPRNLQFYPIKKTASNLFLSISLINYRKIKWPDANCIGPNFRFKISCSFIKWLWIEFVFFFLNDFQWSGVKKCDERSLLSVTHEFHSELMVLLSCVWFLVSEPSSLMWLLLQLYHL